MHLGRKAKDFESLPNMRVGILLKLFNLSLFALSGLKANWLLVLCKLFCFMF